MAILGGREGMLESPVLKRFVAEELHKAILVVLEDRFGPVSRDVAAALSTVIDDARLRELNRVAARCPDLATFHQEALKPIPPQQDEAE
jgi:hypothetical protein